jgi:phosphoheptose isomerase
MMKTSLSRGNAVLIIGTGGGHVDKSVYANIFLDNDPRS